MRNFQLIRTLLNAAFVTHASYLCDGSFFSQNFVFVQYVHSLGNDLMRYFQPEREPENI